MAEQILIISAAHPGYRRGGVALEQGANQFDRDQFSDEQLSQLENDPRLTLAFNDVAETDPDSAEQGGLEPDRLAELVSHIKELDQKNADLWTRDGSPKASSFPKGTTAEERAAAWDAFTDQLDSAD